MCLHTYICIYIKTASIFVQMKLLPAILFVVMEAKGTQSIAVQQIT